LGSSDGRLFWTVARNDVREFEIIESLSLALARL
jgi:hypothetical protein